VVRFGSRFLKTADAAIGGGGPVNKGLDLDFDGDPGKLDLSVQASKDGDAEVSRKVTGGSSSTAKT
jgi:hypothetical protein